jgi:hypothetical protein
MVATLTLVSAAQAVSPRTFVSSTGSDTNTASNCARTSPCRTFASAYSVTSAGGDIVALDAAGYGTLTITSGVNILGTEGAFISVGTGTTGITVNAGSGSGNLVVLRNLQFTGADAANTNGVVVNSGRVIIEQSNFRRLAKALTVNSSKVDVVDGSIVGNTTAVVTTGPGVDPNQFPMSGGTTQVRLSRGAVLDNGTAFFMTDPGLVNASTQNLVTILAYHQAGGMTTVVAGNTTYIAGTGSCTSDPNNCQRIGRFDSDVTGNTK